MEMNRRIVLRARPQGLPRATDFELAKSRVPEPAAGEMLVRVLYCSLDPAVRRWMDEDSYGTAIPLGGAIACLVVGRVVRSHCEGFEAGDFVTGLGSVSDYAVMKPGGFTWKIDPAAAPSLTNHLSVLGANGLTAYNGLLHVGRPRAGETVLVHGAAGGVGLACVDLAKVLGCKVIAASASDAKLKVIADEYAPDAVVNVTGGFREKVKEITGGLGADVIYDPVGGDVFDESIRCIAFDGRLLVVGFTSGRIPNVSVNMPLIKGFSIMGVRAGEYGRQFPEKGRENSAAFLEANPDVMAKLEFVRDVGASTRLYDQVWTQVKAR